MNFNKYRKVKKCSYALIVLLAVLNCSCHRVKPQPQSPVDKPISFKSIANIPFTEVHRRLYTGLSFDKNGYQAEPSYKITFLTNDSATIYSPAKKRFFNFLVFMEKDSIFDVAGSFFKLMYMNKDSLKLQVLEVESDTAHLTRSLVYMTFYANNYIKNVLHTDAATLGRPNRRDTVFIKNKSEIANKIPDSAFAARQPVTITSKSPLVTVQNKTEVQDGLNEFDADDAYMSPEFDININKAYENFSYSFVIFVDDKGQMIFDRSIDYIMPEYKASTIQTLKGIIDGYLKFYLSVTPGSTLGIRHTSIVILNVVGRKG